MTVYAIPIYCLNVIVKWTQLEKLGESPYKLTLPPIQVRKTMEEKSFPMIKIM